MAVLKYKFARENITSTNILRIKNDKSVYTKLSIFNKKKGQAYLYQTKKKYFTYT